MLLLYLLGSFLLNPMEAAYLKPPPPKNLKTPFEYALSSALIPGQGQIDLKQDLLGWGIRAGEVALIGTALIYRGISESNYTLAQAALTQTDQDTYYGNAVGAYYINMVLLGLAAGLYIFNVGEAYVEANNRRQFATLDVTPTTVAVRWDF